MSNPEEIFNQYMSTFDNEHHNRRERNSRERRLAIQNIASLQIQSLQTRQPIYQAREYGATRLWEDYFTENAVYPDYIFRRRFRMNKSLFNRILNAICEYDDYFVQKEDALNRPGLTSYQKMCSALRHLAYGASADIWGEYLCISQTSGLLAVNKFCKAIVAIFGPEYARRPTSSDVARLAEQNSARGFPGMLGSIDCMHWKWKNCPTSYQGSYTGHKHVPTIMLEAVASYDTWIWHSFFGMPGSNNDINVLHRSNVFDDLLHGRSPPINFEINGNQYNMGYYLGDGIYPQYATIVKSFRNLTTRKQKVFCQAQESVRKDVERAFGILQSRFAFVREPAKLWSESALSIVIQACVIMHNMIVDDERRDPTWDYEYEQITPTAEIETQDPTHSFNAFISRETEMINPNMHNRLRNDLVEHIWAMYAASNT